MHDAQSDQNDQGKSHCPLMILTDVNDMLELRNVNISDTQNSSVNETNLTNIDDHVEAIDYLFGNHNSNLYYINENPHGV